MPNSNAEEPEAPEWALWPRGSSEMAQRVRERDWAATALGAVQTWPQSLRVITDLLLASGFPMIALWGPDLIQVYNDSYRDLMGSKHPAGLGQPTQECWPEVWHINGPIYERVWSGDTVNVMDGLYPLARNGVPEDVRLTLSYSPLRDETGKVAGVLVTMYETTGRLLAEQRRAAAEAALRDLTGGVAHDFNNLLQVSRGHLELMAPDLSGQPEAMRRLSSVLSAVDYGARLASQLLSFARRQPLQPEVVNVASFIHGLDTMLRSSLGEQIGIETTTSPSLWHTLADPNQLESALLNLALNARDAMDGRGQLTIKARNVVLAEDYVRRHADSKPGEYVLILVTDTGHGMTREVLAKVFDPFFTTKPPGQGTGLGLSMVYGFVHQSGGHVQIDSDVGHGTTVRLFLPRCDAPAPQPDQSRSAEPVPAETVAGGTETVLVVEDDEEVRGVVIDTLRRRGYRILQAGNAHSALAIIESGIAVDLLFTDVMMPGPMSSTELVERAKALQPRLAVLFTSGYAQNVIVHDGRLDVGVELLTKPYSSAALAQKLRQVLDNRR